MAIIYTETTDTEPSGTVTINNGDLQAFKDVMEQYRFIDQQALLRYALVALLNSSDNKLYIKNPEGYITAMNINSNLIKPNDTESAQ